MVHVVLHNQKFGFKIGVIWHFPFFWPRIVHLTFLFHNTGPFKSIWSFTILVQCLCKNEWFFSYNLFPTLIGIIFTKINTKKHYPLNTVFWNWPLFRYFAVVCMHKNKDGLIKNLKTVIYHDHLLPKAF